MLWLSQFHRAFHNLKHRFEVEIEEAPERKVHGFNTARNVMKCTCKPFEYPAGSICADCIREEEYRLYGTPEQLERELVSLSARPRSLSVFVP